MVHPVATYPFGKYEGLFRENRTCQACTLMSHTRRGVRLRTAANSLALPGLVTVSLTQP